MKTYATGAFPFPQDERVYRLAAEADMPLPKEVGGAE